MRLFNVEGILMARKADAPWGVRAGLRHAMLLSGAVGDN